MTCALCQQPMTACRCGSTPAASAPSIPAGKAAAQILWPERLVAVRLRWRTVTVVLRPFTIRQLQLLNLGLADKLQLATGLTQRQLKEIGKRNPQQLVALNEQIATVNSWDLAALAREMETARPKDAGTDFMAWAADLVAAGHDANRLWDYTPEQFCWWVRRAWEVQDKQRHTAAALDAQSVLAAISAACSKEGVAAFQKWIASLTKEKPACG